MTEASAPGGDSPTQPRTTQPAPQTPASTQAPAAAPKPAAPPAAEAKPPSKPGIKTRFPYQRSCNEKNEKGKLCAGHLKRWYGFGDDLKRQYGADAEIYRCEYCHTLYLPTPGHERRTGTLQF
jgi:hypothetical protein